MLAFVRKCHNFVPVGIEDVLLAASKISMDLTWEQCILRDVGSSGVVVQWQEQKPNTADYYQG